MNPDSASRRAIGVPGSRVEAGAAERAGVALGEAGAVEPDGTALGEVGAADPDGAALGEAGAVEPVGVAVGEAADGGTFDDPCADGVPVAV